MKDLKDTCRVAVVQCAPVMFDKKASTEKMAELIREAGKNGAELIVFPELRLHRGQPGQGGPSGLETVL